jgi:hypothetical protein
VVWRRVVGLRIFGSATAQHGLDLVQYRHSALGISAGEEHVSHGYRLRMIGGANHPAWACSLAQARISDPTTRVPRVHLCGSSEGPRGLGRLTL